MKAMKLPPKFITVMCLVQISLIFMGFLLTRAFLKLYDKATPDMGSFGLRKIPAIVEIIRSYGIWFMLVPVVWCIIASSRGRAASDDQSITPIQFITGIVLTIAVAVTFSFCALKALSLTC